MSGFCQAQKVLISPGEGGSNLSDILPRLAGVNHFTFINARSGYHNLKLDNQSSYLSIFSYPLDRYRYI